MNLHCANCGQWLGDGRLARLDEDTNRCYCVPNCPPSKSDDLALQLTAKTIALDEAFAVVARLTERCDADSAAFCELVDELADARRTINAVTERCDAYREALEPFAKFADEMAKFAAPFPKTGAFYTLNFTVITVEDFKKARAALASPAQEQKDS